MARPGPDQKLLPSLLDRLLDDRPRESREAVDAGAREVARIKESVKRDLEWLLNSKRPVAVLPDDLGHLRQSLLTYGLPDFTTISLNNTAAQEALRRAVEEAIVRFEPRLTAVTITMELGRGDTDRAIRFRIDAMLRVEPEPEPVAFDSVLQLNTRAFVVEGQ
jgi:type VI secretion system protein ImpF